MPLLRGLRLGSALVALVLAGAACGRQQDQPSATGATETPLADRQTLRGDPAAQLEMPGADRLQSVGGEQHATPAGNAPAFDGWIFGIQAAADDVHAYYAAALQQQGWQADTYEVYPTSTDLRAWGWCKPGRLFRLAILDPTAFSPSLSQGRTYGALFHATLNGRTADVACPFHS